MHRFARESRGVSLSILIIAFLIVGDIVWSWWLVRRIEAENPPRGMFVEVDGGRVHVARRDPVGEPRADVLLLHGASGNQADMMEALGDRLTARGFRVFAVDRPGHGYSGGWPVSPSLAQQALLSRKALETLGVHRAIVVGHSLGGAVAENFAVAQTDFAQGIVLIAPVTHPWPGRIRWYYRMAAAPVTGLVFASAVALPVGLATIDAAVASVFKPQSPPADYVARTAAKLVLRPSEFVANARDVAALKGFVTDQSRLEDTIRLPVAIIAGDDTDTIVSTKLHSVASAAAIPGATLKILPDTGHAPHWTAPEAVLSAVEDVFARSAQQERR